MGIIGVTHNWVKEVDYLRGFAILAVIAGHVVTTFTMGRGDIDALSIINYMIYEIATSALPLFVIISGLVLALKYDKKYNIKTFYVKRFNSVMPPYLFFTALYIVFFAAIYGTMPTLLSIAYKFLTATAVIPFYYLAVIIQFYFLYPLIKRIFDYFYEKNQAINFLLLCLAIQILYSAARIIIDISTGGKFHGLLIDDLLVRFFPGCLFYFVVGIHAGRNFDAIKRWLENKNAMRELLIFSVAIILVLIFNLYGFVKVPSYYNFNGINQILLPFAYLSIIIVLYKISKRLLEEKSIVADIIKGYGRYSFGIYLDHVLFLTISVIVLEHFGIANELLFYPIAFIMTAVLSYLGIAIASYLPYSHLIVGTHNVLKKYRYQYDDKLSH